MAAPLCGVTGIKIVKLSDPEEPLEFQLTIAFSGPSRPSVVEAELDSDELMSLLYACQDMQERHKLPMPTSLRPKVESKPVVAKEKQPKVRRRRPKVVH